MVCRLSIYLLSAAVCFGGFIPDNQLGNYSLAGAAIVHRTTIWTTFTAGASSLAISNALKTCPSNKVVYLESGNYWITNNLYLGYPDGSNGVTFRGAGTNTVLLFTNSATLSINGGNWADPGNPGTPATNYYSPVISGLTRGSTNILLERFSVYSDPRYGIPSGQLMIIDQEDDFNLVNHIGSEAFAAMVYNQEIRTNRSSFQVVTVTGRVNETNITFWPPLLSTNWITAKNPQAWWWGYTYDGVEYASKSLIGMEDLTIDYTGTDGSYPIIYSVDNCWWRNINIHKHDGRALAILRSRAITIRDCWFSGQIGMTTTYAINPHSSSDILIENNIITEAAAPIVPEACSGLVIAYNFFTNQIYNTEANAWMPASIEPHGAHTWFILAEGNVGNSFLPDFIWGSGSHMTSFRNHWRGRERVTQNNNTIPMFVNGTNRHVWSVGNVLGDASYHTNIWWTVTNASPSGNKSVYRIGHQEENAGVGQGDTNTVLTFVAHGDWNPVTSGQLWDLGISDHSLPDSLYLTSKPSWFGTLNWPPVDPSVPSVGMIPAQARYLGADYATKHGIGTLRVNNLKNL